MRLVFNIHLYSNAKFIAHYYLNTFALFVDWNTEPGRTFSRRKQKQINEQHKKWAKIARNLIFSFVVFLSFSRSLSMRYHFRIAIYKYTQILYICTLYSVFFFFLFVCLKCGGGGKPSHFGFPLLFNNHSFLLSSSLHHLVHLIMFETARILSNFCFRN